MELKTLIDEAVNGPNCDHARGLLFKKLNSQLMKWAYNMVGNKWEAEDIVHDVFISFMEKLEKFRFESESSTMAYLKLSVFSNCKNVQARKRKSPVIYKAEYEEAEVSPEVYGNMGASEIYKLFEKLPEKLRVMSTMHILEDLNHKEIAGILNISEENSYTRLSRAKAYLKSLITEQTKLYGKV